MSIMRTKLKSYAKEAIVFCIVMLVVANGISWYKSQDLNLEKLQYVEYILLQNQSYKIEESKPVLVHFWATWCPACKIEASSIEKLSKDFEVVTIAVKSGTDQEISKFMSENNYNYNVVNDFEGELSQEFNIAAYPTTFIYDKSKNLRFSEVGYSSYIGLWLRMQWASF